MNTLLEWNSFVCSKLTVVCLSPWTNIGYLEKYRALNTAYLCKLFFLEKKKKERLQKKADDMI